MKSSVKWGLVVLITLSTPLFAAPKRIALPLAQRHTPPPPITSAPLPVQARAVGPVDFCAEKFSVHLKHGESIAWTSDGTPPFWYDLEASPRSVTIGPYFDALPQVVERRWLRLPGSPIAERVVTVPPGAPSSFVIHYLLHGKKRQKDPVDLFFSAIDRSGALRILERVRVGSLAERRCRPTWEASAPSHAPRSSF